MTSPPILFDSTDPTAIPIGAAAVAGYANGRFTWTPEAWDRFPGASKVSIDVLNIPGSAGALDIEKGDASIDDGPGWVRGSIGHGWGHVWLYVDRAQWADLHALMVPAGLPPGSWAYWVADWTGQPHELSLPDGTKAAAVQYADPAAGSGGRFDVSAIFGPLPIRGGVVLVDAPAGQPAASSSPTPIGADDVQIPTIREGATGGAVKSAQAILNAKGGARLATDGVFGPATAAAVTAYQRVMRLAADGIVGPQTWGALIDV